MYLETDFQDTKIQDFLINPEICHFGSGGGWCGAASNVAYEQKQLNESAIFVSLMFSF